MLIFAPKNVPHFVYNKIFSPKKDFVTLIDLLHLNFMQKSEKVMSQSSGNGVTDVRTDGQTDEWMDGRTELYL